MIELLHRAYCDEWLAFYTHWVGARVVLGPMRDAVAAELGRHAEDEIRLAEILADRIIELGGTPVEDPRHWQLCSGCAVSARDDCSAVGVVRHGLEAERCVIRTCRQLLKEAREVDPFTYDLALEILEKEVEHEESLEVLSRGLQGLLEDRE
jgi:bacterioferritin